MADEQLGVLTKSGFVHYEGHFNCVAAVMGSCHGQGVLRMTDWGVLVRRRDDGEWEKVYD